VRTKVTEFLCPINTNEKPIPSLHQSFISKINIARHTTLQSRTVVPEAPALTIGAFWEQTYRLWVEANKRYSTLRGYRV
jgi:hypothetical protein